MILPYRKIWPKIHETAFIAPSADVIGDVEVGANSSVWFQCVLRGDVNWIRIGSRTNVQDHSMLHVTRKKYPLLIGDEVTIGHRVLLHGCTLRNRILVGMGAIIMDDAEIGDECIIGAGTLVTQRMKVPPRSLVVGSPGKVIRSLKPDELAFLSKSAANYVGDTVEYQSSIPGPRRLGSAQADLEDFSSSFVENLGHSMHEDPHSDSDPNEGE
jgi:carbonic anhydrase/acetyltransferase-like protein (isoleucine patch superfamily)